MFRFEVQCTKRIGWADTLKAAASRRTPKVRRCAHPGLGVLQEAGGGLFCGVVAAHAVNAAAWWR